MAAGFGVGMILPTAEAGSVPFSVYLTDKVGHLTKLEVQVGSVQVGREGNLRVVQSAFDLASLHGPRDALLVAQGDLPAGVNGPIRIHFTAVHATIDGVRIEIPDVQDLVLGSLQEDGLPAAALVDIDIPASVVDTAEGLRFAPKALAVYTVQELRQGQVPDFTQVEAMPPPELVSPVDPITSSRAGSQGNATDGLPSTLPGAQAGAPLPNASVEVAPPEAGVPPSVAVGVRTGWLVHFADNMTRSEQMRSVVEGFGGIFVHGFDTFPMAYVLADPVQVRLLGNDTRVVQMEREVPLEFYGSVALQAIRQPAVVHPVLGLKDAAGNPIDGRGVTVAVIDTGIATAHPDLKMAPLGPVLRNVQMVDGVGVPTPYQDVSGHGTHVASIVAGQGAGDPDAAGVAPGAKLVGVGSSVATTNVWAAQALEWVLQQQHEVTPPIRVVTNSWGTSNAVESAAIARLVEQLVDRGIVVVFAAGNSGGDGSQANTSPQCQIAKPGVICVANYDDQGSGTRDGTLNPGSSRGKSSHSSTWPDISAPGTGVYGARPPEGLTTGAGVLNPLYVRLSGTSQAAPQVAGVVALMLQKNPDLTPAQVESALKASAYRYTDGGGYSSSGHYAKGHGLVDAYAAVQRV